MANSNAVSDIILQMSKSILDYDIIFQYTDNIKIDSNQISIKNKTLTNFGSCSYLGLEFDHRLIKNSKNTIDKYGTQFSESRTYVSINAYQQLEEQLEEIFNANVVVTPTTTLGHFSNLPVLINPSTDAIIVDHQVHNSIQMAVQMVKGGGCYTELLRHSRMDLLEERIKVLRSKYKHIWYMADGVYSMFGDKAPMKELEVLLNKYNQFRLYIDDAHGMSVYGKNGRGYVLSEIDFHPNMILGTSLNKAFASGGGVMVYPTKELANRVRVCGGPMITSGPIQPAMLGAAIASASIHLSNEIIDLQNDLHDNILYASMLLEQTCLPVISPKSSTVFFIGVAFPKVGYSLVQKMMNDGFYVNLGLFPAVPIKNTGIRFTITRLHTFKQIEALIKTLEFHWKNTLHEEGVSEEQVYHSFKLIPPDVKKTYNTVTSVINQTLALQVTKYSSIKAINKNVWDSMFMNKGNFDYDGMCHYEEANNSNTDIYTKSTLDYFFIKDHQENVILATFCTCALQKDDMLAPADVSSHVEENRRTNPSYLTSKVLQTGSMCSEGEHIFIDHSSPLAKDALILLFTELSTLQENYHANSISLRDFTKLDTTLESFFVQNGYFKIHLPSTHTLDLTQWNKEEDFIQLLNKKNKKNYNKDIKKMSASFDIEVATSCTYAELKEYYALYLAVKKRNLELNVYEIPFTFFEKMFSSTNSNWELVKLYCTHNGKRSIASITFAYKTGTTYSPIFIGMDYAFITDFKSYKQSLYQIIKRAKELGFLQLNLGFGSSLEKRKLGATTHDTAMFVQIKDSYNNSVINEIISSTSKNNLVVAKTN